LYAATGIQGPVQLAVFLFWLSLPTIFAVHDSALKGYAALLVGVGTEILYLAYGVGEFISLSYEEIKEIAHIVAWGVEVRAHSFPRAGN
jgi:hypothetical protein